MILQTRKKLAGIIKITMVLLLLVGGIKIALAQEETGKLKNRDVQSKHMTGEVSGISSNFLALMYAVDEKAQTSYEMAFSVDKNVKVEGKDKLSEIAAGDTVSVSYDETTEKDEKGENPRIVERLVKRIVLVKEAPPQVKEPVLETKPAIPLSDDEEPAPVPGETQKE